LSLVNQAQILFLLGGLVLLMFLILIEVADRRDSLKRLTESILADLVISIS